MTALTQPTEPPGSTGRDPVAFIQLAVERGASADELDKLLTLHERVTKAEAERAYAEAMRNCQKGMPVVLKTARNSHTGSQYPLFENLLQLVKPIYVSNGFALSFGTDDSILPNHYRVVCDVLHVGGHKERYHADFPADGQGSQGGKSAMNPVQGVGSTFTYARRYLTALIFNLTIAGEDTDAARSQERTDEEIDRQGQQLDAIRSAYEEAHLTDEETDRFWAWVECGDGDFNDISPRRYADILSNLRRKVAAKKKAVAS